MLYTDRTFNSEYFSSKNTINQDTVKSNVKHLSDERKMIGVGYHEYVNLV
jgi:hypothetical protein